MEQTKPPVAMPLLSGFFLPSAPRMTPTIAKTAPSHPRLPAENRPMTKEIIPRTSEATPIFSSPFFCFPNNVYAVFCRKVNKIQLCNIITSLEIKINYFYIIFSLSQIFQILSHLSALYIFCSKIPVVRQVNQSFQSVT